MFRKCLLPAMLIVGLSCGAAAIRAFAESPPVQVVCPAVSFDDHNDRGKSVPGAPTAVDAIVVGAARSVTAADSGRAEIVVERVLFGPRATVFPLADDRGPKATPGQESRYSPEKRIYALTRDGKTGQWVISRHYERERVFALEEEPALAAMARARLDLLVLGSRYVFIGRPAKDSPAAETNAHRRASGDPFADKTSRAGKEQTIAVERVLYGDELEAGQTMSFERFGSPTEADAPHIYFAMSSHPWVESDCFLAARWRVAELPQVESTLQRRSLFPIREAADKDGDVSRSREIIFSGSWAEMIDLIGSSFDAARKLAASSLIAQGDAAIADVASAIEANLFRAALKSGRDFARQEELIRVLAALEDHRADGEIARLIGLMLDRVQAGATFPGSPPGEDANVPLLAPSGQLNANRNHSLAWLLLTLDDGDTARLFGKRLLQLRDRAMYGWLQEIQHVADERHIEDQLELAELRERQTQPPAPLRWQAGFQFDGLAYGKGAFSSDGRYFAMIGSGGGKVWNTADWSLERTLPPEVNGDKIAFSPAGDSLYLVANGKRQEVVRWDWKTGKVLQRFVGHKQAVDEMVISADGRRLLTSATPIRNYAESAILWDTSTGREVERFKGEACKPILLSPDAKWFVGRDKNEAWFRKFVNENRREAIDTAQLVDAAIAPDGTSLYCLEQRATAKSPAGKVVDIAEGRYGTSSQPHIPLTHVLRRRQVSPKWTVEAEHEFDFAPRRLWVSNDGKRLVVADAANVGVVSIPSLKPLARWSRKADVSTTGSDRTWIVSSDARWMISTSNYAAPELYDADDGRRLPLGKSHSGQIVDAQFEHHDAQLQTRGEDGVICLWDLNTARLVRRTGDPATLAPTGQRRYSEVVTSEDKSSRYHFSKGRGQGQGQYAPPEFYTIQVERAAAGQAFDEGEQSNDPFDRDRRSPQNRATELGKIELHWGQFEPFGLAPGGLLYAGTQIFRRDDLKPVSASNVSGLVSEIHFSADGSRYVLLTRSRESRAAMPAAESQSKTVFYPIRVHDTKTGRTLLAVERAESAPRVCCLAISQDNRRLAVVDADNAIQVWTIPAAISGDVVDQAAD